MANSPAFYKSAVERKFNSPTFFNGWASIFENSAAFLKTCLLEICNSLTHWQSDACKMCNCRILQNMISFSPQPKAKKKRRCCSPHSEKQKILHTFSELFKIDEPFQSKTRVLNCYVLSGSFDKKCFVTVRVEVIFTLWEARKQVVMC